MSGSYITKGKGICDWHYTIARGPNNMTSCAKACNKLTNCKRFSYSRHGCRISKCGSDPGPGACPSDKGFRRESAWWFNTGSAITHVSTGAVACVRVGTDGADAGAATGTTGVTCAGVDGDRNAAIHSDAIAGETRRAGADKTIARTGASHAHAGGGRNTVHEARCRGAGVSQLTTRANGSTVACAAMQTRYASAVTAARA